MSDFENYARKTLSSGGDVKWPTVTIGLPLVEWTGCRVDHEAGVLIYTPFSQRNRTCDRLPDR